MLLAAGGGRKSLISVSELSFRRETRPFAALLLLLEEEEEEEGSEATRCLSEEEIMSGICTSGACLGSDDVIGILAVLVVLGRLPVVECDGGD